METRNPYDILGIQRGASEQKIRTAYRRKALVLHPDAVRGRGEPEEKIRQAEEWFKQVNWAYEQLSDPQRRQRYENPPLPHVEPSTISFTSVTPGTVRQASFVLSNVGGPLSADSRIGIGRMEPWIKVVDRESVDPNQREVLPLRIYLELCGDAWDARYAQTIDVGLDGTSTALSVELQTKAKPVAPPRPRYSTQTTSRAPSYGTYGTQSRPGTRTTYQPPPGPQRGPRGFQGPPPPSSTPPSVNQTGYSPIPRSGGAMSGIWDFLSLHVALGFLLLTIPPTLFLAAGNIGVLMNGEEMAFIPPGTAFVEGWGMGLVMGLLANPIPLTIAYRIWNFAGLKPGSDKAYQLLWLLAYQLAAMVIGLMIMDSFHKPHADLVIVALLSPAAVIGSLTILVGYPISLIRIITR